MVFVVALIVCGRTVDRNVFLFMEMFVILLACLELLSRYEAIQRTAGHGN